MIIVVTGGIGSGKSAVTRILCEKYAMSLYDADSKVKEIYRKDPSIVSSLEKALQCSLIDDDGRFVASKLADRIFSSREALAQVESIVFPALMADFERFRRDASGHVVFESATILEKEQFDGFGDIILLVDAPIDVRLERACRRDSLPQEKVLARMSNQQMMNDVSKFGISATGRHIDAIIMNTGTMSDLEREVSRIIGEVLKN